MYHFETIKVVGPPDGRWGQTFSENGLFVILEIEGFEDQAQAGREIIGNLHDLFQRLEEINLKNVKTILENLPLSGNVSILIAAVKNNVLYIAGHGEAEAYLKRKDKFAKIYGGSASSGFIKTDDLLILLSPTFKKIVSPTDLKNLSESCKSLEEADERLAAFIQSNEESSGAAGMIVCFEEKEKTAETQIQTQTPVVEKSDLTIRFSKIFSFLKKHKDRRETLEQENPALTKKKRVTISVGILLSFLLIISLIFGNYQKEKMQQKETLGDLKTEVLDKISQGKALVDLNPQQAKKTLQETKTLLEEKLPDLKEGSEQRKEAEDLLNQVNQALFEAQRIFKVSDAPLFFDLSWVKEGASSKSLSLYNDAIVVLDSSQKSIYKVFLDNKKSELLASGDGLSNAEKIAIHGDNVYVLTKSGGKQIVVNKNLQTVLGKNEDWQNIGDIVSYAGNIYLLDQGGKIWKYSSLESGFGTGKNYLSADTNPDFSQAETMNIDGAVYVLNQGIISKFVSGAPDNFPLSYEDLQRAVNFYTDDELENIYVQDENSAIVVFDKEGLYQARYEWDKIKDVDDFVVSESLGKIFIALDGKIYTIDLK